MSVIQRSPLYNSLSMIFSSIPKPDGPSTGSPRSGGLLILLVLGIALICQPALPTEVYINEMSTRDPDYQWVEFCNASDEWVYLGDGNWRLEWNDSVYVNFSDMEVMGPHELGFAFFFNHPPSFKGVATLIETVRGDDGVTREDIVRDAVSYGGLGSAPLAPAGMSLARVPDACEETPPPPNAATDGLVWTIDPSPTFFDTNNPYQAVFPAYHWINEFDPTPIGGNDPVELYNWTAEPMDVNGWFLVCGDSTVTLTGTIPSGGYHTLLTDPGVDLETSGVIYLFKANGTRIDQLGFHDAPPLDRGMCYGRCPDGGDDFYLGYDYQSSGGNHAFLPQTCSHGYSNGIPCCTSEVDEPAALFGSPGFLRIHPNPFSCSTVIRFHLPEADLIAVQVYDPAGRLVRRLVDDIFYARGDYQATWNGLDDAGQEVGSGLYFLRLRFSEQSIAKRLVLLK